MAATRGGAGRLLGLTALASFVWLGGARPARAERVVDTTALYEVIGYGIADIVFTANDVARLFRDTQPYRASGAIELVVASSQVVVFGLRAERTPSVDVQRQLYVAVAWGAILGVHGLVTLARPARPAPERPPPAVARGAWLDLAPTLVEAGGERLRPGLALAGRF